MTTPSGDYILPRRFAQSLEPRASEVAAAYGHIASIRVRLNKSFHVAAVKRIGSHSRGTAIGTFSDVDVLAVLRRNEARWGGSDVSSASFTRRVAEDLKDRFTATEIRRDAKAVVLRFQGGNHAVDLVPGVFARFEGSSPVYRIPGGSGDWLETSPDQHDRFFHVANARSGGKLRVVSQLIKAWRFGRIPPYALSSFYTDMLLASTGIGAGVQSYGECLWQFFSVLARREGRGMRDPVGIAGTIAAVHSDAARERLANAAASARDRSAAALKAARHQNYVEANRQWSLIFNVAP